MANASLDAQAQADYAAIYAHYLANSPAAAAGFAGTVRRALDMLELLPEAHPFCDAAHRRCQLTRYPYGLIYLFDGADVVVVSIEHDRQMPRRRGGRG